MKTIFILNPEAGKGTYIKPLTEKIQRFAQQQNTDAEWYLTRGAGDATRFVKAYCEQHGSARFIACGGDGTFNEVVNGVMAHPDSEAGIIPVGTGNDFCRNFPKNTAFFDLDLQTVTDSIPCDVIRYLGVWNGQEREGYCANMFNIGFDCNVADKVLDIKKKTFFGGSMAYFVSILWNLIQKKTTELLVKTDGKEYHRGKLLLTSIANGCYCGGGIKSNPWASLTDGRINVNIIKDISRFHFVSLLPSYMKGTHLTKKGIERVIQSIHCKRLTVTPVSGEMRLCVDGEVITAGTTSFEIIPKKLRFVLPPVRRQEAATI